MKTKLLIIHHGALGDVVATFPAILGLRQSFDVIDAIFPGRLGLLGAELKVINAELALKAASLASIYSGCPDPEVISRLRAYDRIVLFSLSRGLLDTINGITGHRAHLIAPRPDVDQPDHITRHVTTNLIKCGLLKSSATRTKNNSLLLPCRQSEGLRPARLLIHPGSGSRKKNWELSNFLKTAKALTRDGIRTQFILGPAEYFTAEYFRSQGIHENDVRLVDDVIELLFLLKSASGFIGNDSGISHLAAFLGLPTVAIFGPSDPRRWQPSGQAVKVLRPDLECSPCFETNENGCEFMECLHGTTPEMVVSAFYGLAGR